MLDQIFSDVDALIVPSAPGPSPTGLKATDDPLFSRMWNLLQLPTVALPFGKDAKGLPLGVQLIARRNYDDRLLAIAEWAQSALAAHAANF